MSKTAMTYTMRSDAGEEPTITAGSLEEAITIAQRRIRRSAWRDGAYAYIYDTQGVPTSVPSPLEAAIDRSEISDEQIEALRIEAGTAGDDRMIETCAAALAGDVQARRKCEQAIAQAEAQAK